MTQPSSVSFDLDLRNQLIEKVGREKAKEVFDLLTKYGIKITTMVSSVQVQLPSLEISTLSPEGEVATRPDIPARRHMFVCKMNGKPWLSKTGPALKRIELDPFDYSDGEVFQVKFTVVPVSGPEEEQ